jgi:hypothetical protein
MTLRFSYAEAETYRHGSPADHFQRFRCHLDMPPLWFLVDHKMCIRRPRVHDPSTCRLWLIRQPCLFGIEWPHDRPVRRLLDRCAASCPWIGGARRGSSVQHVKEARRCVRGLRFVSHQISEPLHGRSVEARIVAHDTGIARRTRPAVVAFAEGGHATRADLYNLCILGNSGRARRHGTLDLCFLCLFTSAGESSQENGEAHSSEGHTNDRAQDRTYPRASVYN